MKPSRHQRQPRRTGDPNAEPRRDRGSDARQRDDDEGHRHERAGRLQRRVAHHELEVRQRQEEEPERGEELDRDGQRSGGKAAPREVPRVEHRLAASQLPEHERHRSQQAGRECGHRRQLAPAPLGTLDDAEDERAESRGREDRADEVEPRRPRLAGGRDDRQRPDERDGCQDDVEDEDRLPGEPLEQNARGEQAEHAAAGGDADPRPDRLAAFLGREDGGDHRQRHRHDHRRADAHQRRGARPARPGRSGRWPPARRGRRGRDRRPAPACDRSGRRARRQEGAGCEGRARTRPRSTAAASARRRCSRAISGSATFRLATAPTTSISDEAHDSQHRTSPLSFVLQERLAVHREPPVVKSTLC